MTRIIDSLSAIAQDYDVLFCDLWGCVHNGKAAYPAAIAALQAFRRTGGRVALVTNAPRPRGAVAAQIAALGVPADAWDEIVTSGDAAQDAMFSGQVGHRVWHVGPPKDVAFFTETDDPRAASLRRVSLEEAEGVVVTGPFDDLTETPEDYRERLGRAAERGLPLLCANPDLVVDYGEQRLYCAGALAQLYEELGGKALYFGKPHPPIYELARRRLGVANARELAIGDGIGTDIAGALAQGIDSLFVTGGLAAEHMGQDVEHPEHQRMTDWLSAQSAAMAMAMSPTYAIGRLR